MPIASTSLKANELSEEQRNAVESLLGRKLEADETVSIRASKGAVIKEAPSGKAREEAYLRLIQHAEETTRRAVSAPDAEIDAAIDEAITQVRRNRG